VGGGRNYSFIQKALGLKNEKRGFFVQTGTVAPGIWFILSPERNRST
jgi:hypothetical protein